MRNKLFINIGIILLAIAIVFFVIRPKYDAVQRINAETDRYKQALQTAGEVQRLLTNIQNRINSIDRSDTRALEAYVPSAIDSLSVSRDIKTIAEAEGMVVSELTAEEIEVPEPEEERRRLDAGNNGADAQTRSPAVTAVADLQSQRFIATLLGTYEEMKRTLEAVERNHYPLRVVNLSFATEEAAPTAQLYTLVLETYALPEFES